MGQALVKTDKNKRAGRGGKGTLTDAIVRGEYTFDPKLRKPERAAHFLDWAARHYPKTYAPHNYVLKAIEGYARLPLLRSEETLALAGAMSRVRKILQERYGRDLDALPGVGVRATVDDADTATVSLPKKVRRFKSAQLAVAKTVALIDPAKLPATPEMQPWKKFTNDVRSMLKIFEAPDFAKKMLPPGSDDLGGE